MPSRLLRRPNPCFHFNSWVRSCQYRPYAAHVFTDKDLASIEPHEHKSFRLRKEGKPLPLPPVLDPVVLKARSRWEQPKAKPNVATLTPFQQKLVENPYGTF